MYYQNAIERGITVQYCSGQKLKNVQRIAKASDAIEVSDTGIFDSHTYFQHLVADLENHGGVLSLNTKVMRVDYQKRKILCECKQLSESFRVRSSYTVNVSGHSSLGILKSLFKEKYVNFEDYFVKGHYFSTNKLTGLNKLYYPMPDELGLGVHLTIDMGGAVKFGPDTLVIEKDINYNQEVLTEVFKQKVMKNFLNVGAMNLHYSYSDIRPKLLKSGVPYNDFMIQSDFDGQFISALGIERPGLTSSLAIGKHINEIMA